MSNQRSENSPNQIIECDCDQMTISESNSIIDQQEVNLSMSPKTPPRMRVPLAKARNQELLMAPKMKISRNRRRLMWIEDPSTEISVANNEYILDMYRRWSDGTPRDNTGRLVYPRRARIRRDLFNARNLNSSTSGDEN